MSRGRSLEALAGRLRRGEDGFAIVIVLLLLAITLAAGGAALAETLAARDSATRTGSSARALQAADAGIQTELYRANQLNMGSLNLTGGLNLGNVLKSLLVCPVPTIGGSGQIAGLSFAVSGNVSGTPGGANCNPNSTSGVTGAAPNNEPVGNHAYFQTQFVPGVSNVGDFIEFTPKIVALGMDTGVNGNGNPVTRRIEAILAPVTPWRTLEALNNLEIDVPPSALVAGVTAFNGTAAAGGNFTLKGQGLLGGTLVGANINGSSGLGPSAIDYCGTETVTNMLLSGFLGDINHVTSGCSSLVSRPPITISSTKGKCVPTTGLETCSNDAGFGTAYVSGRNADGTVNPAFTNEDEIYNTSGATLKFAPGDYVFCSFYSNGPVNLNPAGGQAVRIFIDSPSSSRCSGFVSHNGISAGSFTATQGVGNLLAATQPSQGQIYVAGSPVSGTPSTSVTITGSALLSLGQSGFVYAPRSNVTVDSSLLGTSLLGTLSGSFVGYNLTVSAPVINQDLGLLNYPLSTSLGPFYVKQYVECPAVTTLPEPDPASGC
jgi:hypothetical protein